VTESAGKKKGKNSTGHGNTYLARILGNAAAAAGRTDTFPGERYRRIARRPGAQKAHVAIRPSLPGNHRPPASPPTPPFPRPPPRVLRPPHRSRAPPPQPHPPARSTRLHRHPRTQRLTSTANPPGSAALRRVLPRAQ